MPNSWSVVRVTGGVPLKEFLIVDQLDIMFSFSANVWLKALV